MALVSNADDAAADGDLVAVGRCCGGLVLVAGVAAALGAGCQG